jgi:hypothetical protein
LAVHTVSCRAPCAVRLQMHMRGHTHTCTHAHRTQPLIQSRLCKPWPPLPRWVRTRLLPKPGPPSVPSGTVGGYMLGVGPRAPEEAQVVLPACSSHWPHMDPVLRDIFPTTRDCPARLVVLCPHPDPHPYAEPWEAPFLCPGPGLGGTPHFSDQAFCLLDFS